MPTADRRPVPVTIEQRSSQGLTFLAIGALAAGILVGGYVALGTPGLHTQVAKAPVTEPAAALPAKE